MISKRRAPWLVSIVITALIISGCTLSGAEPAPPFEPSDDGGAPALDAGGETDTGTTDDQQPPLDTGETDGEDLPADDGEMPGDDGDMPTDDGGAEATQTPTDGGDIIEPTDTGEIDVFGTQTAEAEATDEGEPGDGGDIIEPTDAVTDGGEEGTEETPAVPTPVPTTQPEATPTPAPPGDDTQTSECTYTVQPGDNLFRIALNNGLTTDELAAANGITNPQELQVGTVLVLPLEGCPSDGGTTGGDTSGQTYTVQPGDTLYRIALRFGVTVEALAAANGIADPSSINVGDVLTIP